jgi:phosphatidylserine decarboxylase
MKSFSSFWSHRFESSVGNATAQLLGWAAERHVPQSLLGPFIAAYAFLFGVDMGVIVTPSGGFGCFADFFARRLRPEARPVSGNPDSVVSPCDGVLVDWGRISENGLESRITVKGVTYAVADLIGASEAAADLAGGGYCVLYLHPRDYHRVHVPMDSTLRQVRHVPGAHYPVAPWAAKFAGPVLGKNERVAFDLELRDEGRRCVLVMVAAFAVGGIESPFLEDKATPMGTVSRTSARETLARGDELGAFRIGSTVVLLWPQGALELDPNLGIGARVLVGETVGRLGT